jgi:serine/threonine-protein kinase ATR
VERLNHDNLGVVLLSLRELATYLRDHQHDVQTLVAGPEPGSVGGHLMRSLLDCCYKYNGLQSEMSELMAECIGLLGCLDPNRLEMTREDPQFVVVDNFDDAGETSDFVLFMLENVMVKAFLSTSDTQFQGYLSWAMQELLDKTDFSANCLARGQTAASRPVYQKWLSLSEPAREVLTPFLSTRYMLADRPIEPAEYPLFKPGKQYRVWIKSLVLDLLRSGQNTNSGILFRPLQRLIKVRDLSVTEFLLPYVVLHHVVGCDRPESVVNNIIAEMVMVLQYQPVDNASYVERAEARLYYEVSQFSHAGVGN